MSMHVYIYPRGIFDFYYLDYLPDATCLLNSGMVHLTCSGYQKEASIIWFSNIVFVKLHIIAVEQVTFIWNLWLEWNEVLFLLT